MTNKKMLFVSDVHLGGFSKKENDRLESKIIHLIDYCEEQDYQICILGDLFDYWMEYPDFIPDLGKHMLLRFQKYNDRKNGRTLYITGNHDNWTGGYFEQLGFDVERDCRIFSLNGREVLLLHGDGVAEPGMELPRPLLHRLIRHPWFIKIYQTILPPGQGLWLMKYFSAFTRDEEPLESEQEVLDHWAEKKLKKSEIDAIVCGHDHLPRLVNYDFGTFINLGTFYQHQTVATYNNSEFKLVVWNDSQRKLKPFYLESEIKRL